MRANSNTRTRAQAKAQRALSHYLATRRAYQKRQATIQQVAKALALFDLTLAIANLPSTRKPS
jgi:hypothetical protein